MSKDEIQIIQNELPVYQQSEMAAYDIQISTAKKFPRNLVKFRENVVATITLDDSIAASCGYALPRAGKQIQGASVHLARIMAQFYGNIRVEKKGSMISDKYLTAEAVAFDLETNYAIKVEARRKIVNRNGQRYNDDMINTTMLAAMAVAERNAIFAVIPKGFIDDAYKAAQNKLTGDLSDEQKLTKARKKMVDTFLKDYDVKEIEILAVFGKTALSQINATDIATLRALYQALKDGDTTVNNAFNREKGENRDGETVKKEGDNFADDKAAEEVKTEK